jgi:hypothetical protein
MDYKALGDASLPRVHFFHEFKTQGTVALEEAQSTRGISILP